MILKCVRRATGRVPATLIFIAASVTVACGGDENPGALGPAPIKAPDLLGNPVEGKQAFIDNCAMCHASRDGFDLAAFSFSSFDIVRRGIAHVDSATARDIAAHIDQLQQSPVHRAVAPFQPQGKIRGDRPAHLPPLETQDREFWVEVFGTSAFPSNMTASTLRSIDPRDYAVPLGMPLWSMEGSDEDWMPDTPMPPEVLDADGGVLRAAITAYYEAPSEARLILAVETFGTVSKAADRICWRQDPFPCFNARRWMASLGAQHYMRIGGDPAVHARVARVWWDVGESAIALQSVAYSQEKRDEAFRIGARWMWVAYQYAPEAFREPAEYMGTFLRDQGLFRTVLFATLRRMVGDGIAHADHPDQFIHDGRLAVRRSDGEVGLAVTEFVFQHFADRLSTGLPANLDKAWARQLVGEAYDSARRFAFQDRARWDRVQTLHARVLGLLAD